MCFTVHNIDVINIIMIENKIKKPYSAVLSVFQVSSRTLFNFADVLQSLKVWFFDTMQYVRLKTAREREQSVFDSIKEHDLF